MLYLPRRLQPTGASPCSWGCAGCLSIKPAQMIPRSRAAKVIRYNPTAVYQVHDSPKWHSRRTSPSSYNHDSDESFSAFDPLPLGFPSSSGDFSSLGDFFFSLTNL